MAKINVIEQTINFLSTDNSFDYDAILASPLIQVIASNSLGNDLLTALKPYIHWDGSQWKSNWLFEIRCYVTAAFQSTIQNNIGVLQTAFPEYTIVTWGYAMTYGA